LYYPRLNDDLIDYAISIGTQVKDLDVLNMDLESLLNITLLGVCVEKCPTFGTVVCTNDYELSIHQEYLDKHKVECDPKKDGQCKPHSRDVGKCQGGELFFGLVKNPYYYLNTKLCTNCWVVPLNTTEIFYRCLEVIYTKDTNQEKCIWPKNEKEVDGKIVPLKPGDKGYIKASDDACITKEVLDDQFATRPAYDNPVAEMLGETLMTLQGWIRDIFNAKWVILMCGCLATVAMGFLWILLLRWLTKPIVWGTITLFLLVLFLGAIWSYLNSGWIPSAILATWLAEQFHILGISHPILDYIVTSLNTTGSQGNLTAPAIPDNPITQVIGNSLPYDLEAAGAIKIETLWQISAITSTVLLIAGIVAVIILAKKIAIAIAIIEEAGIAVMRMPHMVFLPFATAACILVVFLWFALLGILITSLEDVMVEDVVGSVLGWVNDNVATCNSTNISSLVSLEQDKLPVDIKLPDVAAASACNGISYFNKFGDKKLNDALMLFHLFCFLWTNELLQAITICIVAGAVCDWYWTRPSGPTKAPPNSCCYKIPCFRGHGPDPKLAFKGGDGKSFQFPLMRSVVRTFRFHLGSLAFGSFLVAVVQLLRIIFEYIKKETKGWAEKNKCFKLMLKIITVILLCFERCLKYITKNAYIMIAMQGHAFCDAACHGFKLLLTNLIQFVLVSCFSKVVIFLGKVTIMGTSVVGAFFWLSKDPAFQEWTGAGDEDPDGIQGRTVVNNKFMPLILIALLGYFCAAAFLHVYDLAIASILLCFCEDYKVHQIDEPTAKQLHKEVYMPNSLRSIVLTPEEFAHMTHPLTTEELMNMAGVDTRSDAEKEEMTRDEVLDVCVKLLVESDGLLHLHKTEANLTDKDIIDNTGGAALRKELSVPNPFYEPDFIKEVEAGNIAIKKGFKDKRLEKYKVTLTMESLLQLIEDAGIMRGHKHTMTHEDVVGLVAADPNHGPEVAELLDETPSRKRVAKRNKRRATMEQKRLGNKIQPKVEETPVRSATDELKAENDAGSSASYVSEEAMI